MRTARTVRTTTEQLLQELIAQAYSQEDVQAFLKDRDLKDRVLEGHEVTTMRKLKAREVATMLKRGSVGAGGFVSTPPIMMDVSDLLAWRQLVREAVESIIARGAWRPSGRLDLSVQLLRGPDGTVRRLFASNDKRPRQNWRTATIVLLSALLERAGGQLRRCARAACGNVMVRHGRSEYCSVKCSQRVRSATHYRVHRDAVRQRRVDRYAEARRPRRVHSRRRR